ncbi:MAG: hypothetical protein ACOCVT_03035 [bacterium]
MPSDLKARIHAPSGSELLQYQQAFVALYQTHPTIHLPEGGALNFTEQTPVGGLQRVNLSNLRQASGRARIEDCPVDGGMVRNGKLITERLFRFETEA